MMRYPCRLPALLLAMLAIAWSLVPGVLSEQQVASAISTDPFTLGWQAYNEGRFKEAFRIWQMLAEQGIVGAQVNLGAMYDNGTGVLEDPAAAVKWYRAAAKQNDRGAQYNLGLMYAAGRGVLQNMIKAAAWYRKSAEQGFASAQYNLGMLYASGKGVAQNHDLAIDWFHQSALSYLEDNNSEEASMAVEAINRLSPDNPLGEKLLAKIRLSTPEAISQPPPGGSPGTSIGTAWPIASGYVVTNDHVIAESTDVILINKLGQEIAAQVVLRDETGDIALLEVNDLQKLPPALPLATAQASLGANVFTIGFPRPDVMGKTPKLSEGVISAINGLRDDPGSYQTTVPIQPGNSGGPLFNMSGEVIAVVKSMLGFRDERRGDITMLQNISCALKIQCVKDLLDLLPRQDPAINELASHSGNLETLAGRVQDSVLIVIAR